MAIDKKFTKKLKYKLIIKAMRELGMNDYDIESILQVKEDLKGWKPITFQELKEMPEAKLAKLKAYCWHDGHPRCDCIGIENVAFEERGLNGNKYWLVTYSNQTGDPRLECRDLGAEINNLGDGEWNYGLYKKGK